MKVRIRQPSRVTFTITNAISTTVASTVIWSLVMDRS